MWRSGIRLNLDVREEAGEHVLLLQARKPPATTLRRHLAEGMTFEGFFADARLNPNAALITGVICGVRVQEIENPLMQKIRYLDKLVDELAKGKPMEKILRA